MISLSWHSPGCWISGSNSNAVSSSARVQYEQNRTKKPYVLIMLGRVSRLHLGGCAYPTATYLQPMTTPLPTRIGLVSPPRLGTILLAGLLFALCVQECEPRLFVDDPLDCIARNQLSHQTHSGLISVDLHTPFPSVTVTYRAPSFTNICCISSNGECICTVNGACKNCPISVSSGTRNLLLALALIMILPGPCIN